MANGLPIDIKTFNNLKSTDAKLDAMFEVLVTMHCAGYEAAPDRNARLLACENRFRVLERRKWLDRGAAIVGGAIAGLLGALGIKIG